MSSSSASASARVGPGFLGLLTLLLVAGKLFVPETATYSWLVAFAPVLFGVGLALVVLFFILAIYLVDEGMKKRERKQRIARKQEIRKNRTF